MCQRYPNIRIFNSGQYYCNSVLLSFHAFFHNQNLWSYNYTRGECTAITIHAHAFAVYHTIIICTVLCINILRSDELQVKDPLPLFSRL